MRRELVVFWSPLDVVILGAGTKFFGTADRIRTVGAGLVGFRLPGTEGRPHGNNGERYEKLRTDSLAGSDGGDRLSGRSFRNG